jgi:hypothetical protein
MLAQQMYKMRGAIFSNTSKSACALHREKRKLARSNESSVMTFVLFAIMDEGCRILSYSRIMINMLNPKKMSL